MFRKPEEKGHDTATTTTSGRKEKLILRWCRWSRMNDKFIILRVFWHCTISLSIPQCRALMAPSSILHGNPLTNTHMNGGLECFFCDQYLFTNIQIHFKTPSTIQLLDFSIDLLKWSMRTEQSPTQFHQFTTTLFACSMDAGDRRQAVVEFFFHFRLFVSIVPLKSNQIVMKAIRRQTEIFGRCIETGSAHPQNIIINRWQLIEARQQHKHIQSPSQMKLCIRIVLWCCWQMTTTNN